MDQKNTRLFALHNAQKLGNKISKILGISLSKINRTVFADGEILVQSDDYVRNMHTYIVASTSTPTNSNIMELLIFIDSLKRASAKTITVVLTYYGYSRQDRKAKGRQPISARLIADLLQTAGATKIITVDLHNPSIQGFFNIPLDDLKGQYIIAKEIKKTGKFTVVSPDHGGTVRARVLAELISPDIQIAIIDKRRTAANQSEVIGILGDVKDRNIVIIDDMIDTGNTIIKAAKSLKEKGAKKIIVAATHGIFSKGFDHFDEAKHIDQVIITDSIEKVYEIKSKKLLIASLDKFIASTILATGEGTSISDLYKKIKETI
ncbi:ribose-phosphate pyrophosphokinase [Candidatus Mycoplasma mahonii]|uniref:ribose-phosphate pyrophosphokinase n=1 Tax=Candidatus Mycoplasma mahonii TaxID=3004105 RepID=UPI0026EA7AD0|nr:ribose-phosphate pyrophosphokinase [Candidatus Mycoplasma mahonii]WKX02427.1 ribose-phosphate pyrophosphokinase [Candidatus Mycoplasma mahonii]